MVSTLVIYSFILPGFRSEKVKAACLTRFVCHSQIIFPLIAPGGDHEVIPGECLTVADYEGGLHGNLIFQHPVKGCDDNCFVISGRCGDDAYRRLGIAAAEENLPCADNLFRPLF